MAILRDPGSELVAQFSVPYLGTLNSIAAHEVPQNALYNSYNVYVRKGKLRARPGLSLFGSTEFPNDVIGSSLAVTPLDDRVIAITQYGLFELGQDDVQFTQTVTAMFANSQHNIIDIAFMETGSTYVGILACEGLPVRAWNNITHTADVVTFTGYTPVAKSVCIASRRAVYLEPPHTVRWSRVFDYANVSANSYNKVAQTNDRGICIRSLSSLSYVLYKDRSIYVARSQAGSDENAFTFGEPIRVEGPAGIKAVVDVNGMHFYMTKNGRIAVFDGSSYPTFIADGLWLFLQEDINPVYAYKIHGIYDHRLHTVTFFYPRGNSALLTGMVIINLPYEGDAFEQQRSPHVFLGETVIPVTSSCEMRFERSINRSILFGVDIGMVNLISKPFAFNETVTLDNNLAFPCAFQTGLQSMPDTKIMSTTVESYLERDINNGRVLIDPVVADTLENEGGEVLTGKTQNIDLSKKPKTDYQGFHTQYRYFGLKYSWSSDNIVKWAGAAVYGIES